MPSKFEDVISAETDAIRRRRVEVFGSEECDEDRSDTETYSPTVGLALSGGGIRSACFGLGFLQSLYRRGILCHVDYLSTVSGGGYIGSHLSSSVTLIDDKINWRPDDEAASGTALPILPSADGQQPPEVRRLAHSGQYLLRPLRFLAYHFWGLFAINTFILSGLAAVAALAAHAYRFMDGSPVQEALGLFGFSSDVARALFPTIAIAFLWLPAVAISAVYRPAMRVLQALTILLAVTGVLGLTTCAMTGDLVLYTGLSRRVDEYVIGWIKLLEQHIRIVAALPPAFDVVEPRAEPDLAFQEPLEELVERPFVAVVPAVKMIIGQGHVLTVAGDVESSDSHEFLSQKRN